MSYLVLARKWRPQGFEAITGQEHVTRTLQNAIRQDRVHHAFLFSGARGVGKTSAARVLARALNCTNAERATVEPCGTCVACKEIALGTSIDVFEIDGASNRGINEIRELRDGVAYAPQRDRYKIYIIDEVHMLTTEAFNALLKTLEEPPSHVKFIFATTEPHKIPVTILSRCQRFDFKRIPRGTMVQRLEEILAAEGVKVDDASLRLVARESEGSMRDALSLLDRIISFCGDDATFDRVAQVLGVADRGWLAKVVRAALERDAARALAVVEQAFEYGLDLRQFATDLVHYLRDIIVLKVAGDGAGLTDLSTEETGALAEMGRDRSPEDLQRLASIVIKTAERLAHANFPRLELEMAVIRMCGLRPLQPIDAMVARLEAIERHLSSGAPLPTPAPVVPVVAPVASNPDPINGGSSVPNAPRVAPVAAPTAGVSGPEPKMEASPAPVAQVVAPSVSSPVSEAPPTPQMVAPPAPVAAAVPERPQPPAGAAGIDAPQSFDNDDWEAFVDAVREVDAGLAGSLDQAQVTGLHDGVLTVAFGGSASAGFARRGEEHLNALLSERFDGIRALKIDAGGDAAVDDTPYQRRQEREEKDREARRQELRTHPLVVDVITRFGGTLERIELDDGERSP